MINLNLCLQELCLFLQMVRVSTEWFNLLFMQIQNLMAAVQAIQAIPVLLPIDQPLLAVPAMAS